MASFHIFFSISFLILFFLCRIATSQNFCQPSYCGDNSTVLPIKFPFQLNTTQTKGCGYPGFNLSCNNRNQTILTHPYSGDFVVESIYYFGQSISIINDPDYCLARWFLNQNITLSALGSPFHLDTTETYTCFYYNCSSNVTKIIYEFYLPVYCLSRDNLTVLATP